MGKLLQLLLKYTGRAEKAAAKAEESVATTATIGAKQSGLVGKVVQSTGKFAAKVGAGVGLAGVGLSKLVESVAGAFKDNKKDKEAEDSSIEDSTTGPESAPDASRVNRPKFTNTSITTPLNTVSSAITGTGDERFYNEVVMLLKKVNANVSSLSLSMQAALDEVASQLENTRAESSQKSKALYNALGKDRKRNSGVIGQLLSGLGLAAAAIFGPEINKALNAAADAYNSTSAQDAVDTTKEVQIGAKIAQSTPAIISGAASAASLTGKAVKGAAKAAQPVAKSVTRGAVAVADKVSGKAKKAAEAAKVAAEKLEDIKKTKAAFGEVGVKRKFGEEGLEQLAKSATNVAEVSKEPAEKVIQKIVEKRVAKDAAKIAVKKVPIAGLAFSTILAGYRATQGDFAGAGLEVASGLSSTIPGAGTLASAGIDVGLIVRDAYFERYGCYPEDDPEPNKVPGRIKELAQATSDYLNKLRNEEGGIFEAVGSRVADVVGSITGATDYNPNAQQTATPVKAQSGTTPQQAPAPSADVTPVQSPSANMGKVVEDQSQKVDNLSSTNTVNNIQLPTTSQTAPKQNKSPNVDVASVPNTDIGLPDIGLFV